ncbi:MAG TPA: TetR/AcrR family transcriptional regulator [Actinomycetales bacterium]|nr:TetR/AcrR family transcriptional regulator [Actinomycetales bacterium]
MTKRLLTSGSPERDQGVKAKAQDTGPLHEQDIASLGAKLPDTAQRLLEAAVDTFAEQGYHATTTRDIAQRAGLSPAGLYVHYPSKSALLGHLSRIGHEAALRLVRHTLALPGDSPRRLHALVAAFVTWHAEHHTVARVVHYQLQSLDAADREAVTAMRRELERLVEAEVLSGAAAGTLDVAHPRQATRAVLSLAIDVARWYDPRGAETPRRLGRIYADLAVRMLGAAQEPFADQTSDVAVDAQTVTQTETQTDPDDDTHDRTHAAVPQGAATTETTEAQDPARDKEHAE